MSRVLLGMGPDFEVAPGVPVASLLPTTCTDLEDFCQKIANPWTSYWAEGPCVPVAAYILSRDVVLITSLPGKALVWLCDDVWSDCEHYILIRHT
jgi:hypothetical protein